MKWLLIIPLVAAVLGLGAIVMNRPPLLDPPGLWPRLRLYLTTNVAETRSGHLRAELRPRVYAPPLDELRRHVRAAVAELGWRDIREDPGGTLRAVVRTPLLGFKDDVEIRLEPVAAGTRVGVRSVSRVGRGDFGANTRHVLDLYAALARRIDGQTGRLRQSSAGDR